MAEMSAFALRCIRVFELPPHMRRNADDVQQLFAPMFGPVDHVSLENVAKGIAVVTFAHRCSVEACLNRIIQHEVLNEAPTPEQRFDAIDHSVLLGAAGGSNPSDADDDSETATLQATPKPLTAARDHDGPSAAAVVLHPAHWRRGYVYLGYFRILVEGGVCVDLSPDGLGSGHDDPQHVADAGAVKGKDTGVAARGANKRPRSRPAGDDGGRAASSSGDSSSSSSSDDEGSDTNSEGSSTARRTNDDNGVRPASSSPPPSTTATKAQPPNCLVLLRMVELPVSSGDGSGPQVASGGASGILSPLIVYQMLRDVCLPLKIVLCKKQSNSSNNNRGGGGGGGYHRGGAGGGGYEARNVLVQVSKAESVADVVQAFNGIVVELMEGPNGGGSGGMLPSRPTTTTTMRPTTVAARFRVLACESKQTDGRQNELNVAMNLPGCLSVSQQSIMKMGGVFDRQWALPAGRSEALLGVDEGAGAEGDPHPQQQQHLTHHQYHGSTNTSADDHRAVVHPPRATHATAPAADGRSVHAHPQQQHQPQYQQPQHQQYHQYQDAAAPASASQPSLRVGVQAHTHRDQHHHHHQDARQPSHRYREHSGSRGVGGAAASLLSSSAIGESEWRWSPVFSDEYQRTYYVATHVETGEQRTSWVLPPDVVLSTKRR